MNATYLERQVIPDELVDLLMPVQENGHRQLVPVPASDLARFPQTLLSQFCLEQAFYQLPTTELIDWLSSTIGDRRAIEIGAGNGAVGRALGLVLTDSYLQDGTNRVVAEHYARFKQPLITYGADVIKLPAVMAVAAYCPQVILGCWITHLMTPQDPYSGNPWGVDEEKFKGRAEQYVMVGNTKTHADKPILKKFPYEVYEFDWLYSRSVSKETNRIWVFDLR